MFALALLQLSAGAVAAPDCHGITRTHIGQKSGLPAEVATALPSPMAEHGQPFQAGDVISSPRLPLYRFVEAEQRGCRLTIIYEHGGRGYGTGKATFEYGQLGWLLITSV